MEPLPGGRERELWEMLCDRTEEMTTGKSVARTSQPSEQRASLRFFQREIYII